MAKYGHVAERNNLRFIPAVFSHTGQIHEVFKSFVKALPALELSGQIHNLDQPRDWGSNLNSPPKVPLRSWWDLLQKSHFRDFFSYGRGRADGGQLFCEGLGTLRSTYLKYYTMHHVLLRCRPSLWKYLQSMAYMRIGIWKYDRKYTACWLVGMLVWYLGTWYYSADPVETMNSNNGTSITSCRGVQGPSIVRTFLGRFLLVVLTRNEIETPVVSRLSSRWCLHECGEEHSSTQWLLCYLQSMVLQGQKTLFCHLRQVIPHS